MSAVPRLHYILNPITLAERIDEFAAKHGSLRNAAKILEVDAGYLSCIKHGKKEPSDKVLFRLGLKKHVHYSSFRKSY
jgi:hypothetical protein